MKKLIYILTFLFSGLTFGQPDPAMFYPEKIEYITEQLKKEPLNYELIWERLHMKVALLMRENEQFGNVFVYYPDNQDYCKKK